MGINAACNGEIALNSGKMTNIAPWSAESPTLYTLTVRVVGHDGAIIETVTQKIASAHSASKTAL